jgi:hypothetical protein
MKSLLLIPLLFAASLFAVGPIEAKTLAYPGPDNASFLVDHPADWEVEPGEEVGDYVTLTGPTGVNLQLRTIPGDQSAMDDALAESFKFLEETFTNVEMLDPETTERDGLTMMTVAGKGVDAEGEKTGFILFYAALNDGNIAEIWFSVYAGDQQGIDAATKVLRSFRMP